MGCVEEAEEKRRSWAREAAAVTAQLGEAEAARHVALKVQHLGVSMCAEARMKEAIEETLDGSRLPDPAGPESDARSRTATSQSDQGSGRASTARPATRSTAGHPSPQQGPQSRRGPSAALAAP